MNQTTDNKHPVIRKGKAGYWHVYGKGWAVCASTREAALQRYDEMLKLINELISRPIIKTSET